MMHKVQKYFHTPKHAAWLFLAPASIVLLTFVGIPLIASFVMSTSGLTVFLNDFSFIGFSNFVRAFKDGRMTNAMLNTFVFTIVSVPLQMVFALLCAFMLAENKRLFRFLRGIYFIPTLCSFTALGVLFTMLLDTTSGIIPYWLKCLGVANPPMLTEKHSAMAWIIIITLWRNFGTSMVILIAGIQGISRNLYDAASMDGASTMQQLRYITIPQLTSSLGFCILTESIGCMQMFDQAYVLTQGGPMFGTESIVQYIYSVAFQNYELGYASAIAVILFFIIMIIVSVLNRWISKKERENYG